MTWESLPGWFDFQSTYAEWILETPKYGTIVEVGVYLGRSLAYLARQAIDQGRDDLRIVGVDPWAREDWMLDADGAALIAEHEGDLFEAFRTSMRRNASEELARVETIRGTSDDAVIRLLTVDRVYIDGDHSTDACARDIATWLPLMKPGGVIGGHDYGNFGVEPAVRAAFGDDIELRGSTWLHRVKS